MESLSQLVVEVAGSLEILNTLEVFFFLQDTLVKLLLDHTVLLFRTFKFLGASLDVLLDNLLDVLKVVEQDLFGLLRSRLFVGVVDFDKVVLLLLKKDFSVLNGIE